MADPMGRIAPCQAFSVPGTAFPTLCKEEREFEQQPEILTCIRMASTSAETRMSPFSSLEAYLSLSEDTVLHL